MAETRKQTSRRPSGVRATDVESEDGRLSGVVQDSDRAGEAQERTTTLRLPALTVAVTRRAVPGSSVREAVSGAPGGGAPASRTGKLAFYGGIAALGVFEVVEWPVAVALGAGAYLLRRMRPGTGRAAVPSERLMSRSAKSL